MSIVRHEPWTVLSRWHRDFDQFFGAETPRANVAWIPSVDVREESDRFVVQADLPGVAEKDVDISLTGNQLTLSGKREAKQKKDDERYHSFERSFGSFTRSFTLPDSVDAENITANYDNGVLSIIVPVAERAKPRKIQVAAAGNDNRKAVNA